MVDRLALAKFDHKMAQPKIRSATELGQREVSRNESLQRQPTHERLQNNNK